MEVLFLLFARKETQISRGKKAFTLGNRWVSFSKCPRYNRDFVVRKPRLLLKICHGNHFRVERVSPPKGVHEKIHPPMAATTMFSGAFFGDSWTTWLLGFGPPDLFCVGTTILKVKRMSRFFERKGRENGKSKWESYRFNFE